MSKSQPTPTPDSLISDNAKVTLTLDWKDVAAEYQRQLARRSQNLKAAGFRKGNVPKHMAESMIGKAALVEATLNAMLPAAWRDKVTAEKLAPVTQPEFNPQSLEWEKNWEIEAQFATEPNVKLGNYKKIIKTALDEAAKTAQTADESKKGDTSESKTKEKSAEDLKDDQLHHIYRALVKELKPAIPELLLKEQTRYELERLARSLYQSKISVDAYLKQRGITQEQLTQEVAAQSLGQLQLETILKAIIEQEKITVSEADVMTEYTKVVTGHTHDHDHDHEHHDHQHHHEHPPATPDPQVTNYLTSILQRRKLNDFLLSK